MEGKRVAKEDGVEARASVGKSSSRSGTSYRGDEGVAVRFRGLSGFSFWDSGGGLWLCVERVVDAYVETESRGVVSWSARWVSMLG